MVLMKLTTILPSEFLIALAQAIGGQKHQGFLRVLHILGLALVDRVFPGATGFTRQYSLPRVSHFSFSFSSASFSL